MFATSLTGRLLGAAAVVVLGLTACSSSGPATTGADTGAAASTVTLLTYDSYAISKKTLREFTDRTGIEVDLIRAGDAAEVVNRALLTAGNPEADVLFGVDNNLMSRALAAGLFVPHEPADADALPAKYVLDPQFRVTPVDVGDVCVNVDKTYFADRDVAAPKTLADLTEGKYRDLLVVENPATSTPGLAFLLATVAEFGADEDGFADYWERLRANGVRVENSWDNAYREQFSGGSGQGDRPLVVSYASSPPYEAMSSPSGEAPTGVLADTCYRQIEFAGVLANAANPAGAQDLVDFMVSKTYQADLPLQNFVWPVRPDVPSRRCSRRTRRSSRTRCPYLRTRSRPAATRG